MGSPITRRCTACRCLFPEEPAARSGTASQSAFKLNSVGSQFRTQLKGLMATLTECQPHYVRCAAQGLRPG